MLPYSEILQTLLYEEHTLDFLAATQEVDPVTLAKLVTVLRRHAHVPVGLRGVTQSPWQKQVDVCGTGGSQSSKPNASTLLAFFAPACGIRVCKHGGKSRSGNVGSVDFLTAIGFSIDDLYNNSADTLRATGLCFLSVSHTYPFFVRSGELRTKWGKPSIFNLLGPLLTPVSLTGRLLGASRLSHARILAQALVHLQEPGCVICGEDTEGVVDEALPWGCTHVFCVRGPANGGGTFSVQDFVLEGLWNGGENGFLRSQMFKNAKEISKSILTEQPQDFVSQPLPQQAVLAMIYANLTLLTLVNQFGDVPGARDADLCHNRFQQFCSASVTLQQKAQQLFGRLLRYTPLHPRSPTRVGTQPHGKQDSADISGGLEETKVSPKSDAPLSVLKRNDHSKSRFWPQSGGFIAEIKIHPPQALRAAAPAVTLSVEQRVQAYAQADAMSVVTHGAFGGSIDLLRRVRTLTNLPLLAKDFVREPEHLEALAQAGADAVLLLADFVDSARLHELASKAVTLGVLPVIESTWSVPHESACLFNSRNLFSLEVGRSYRDAVYFDASSVGAGTVLASSFEDPLEVRSLLLSGVNVLVGSALMKLQSETAIRDFISSCKQKKLLFKACGAGGQEDIEMALSAGADLVGINVIPSSKRFCNVTVLQDLLPTLKLYAPQMVLLTHATTPPEIVHLLQDLHVYEQPYETPICVQRRGILAPWHQRQLTVVRMGILESGLPGSGKISAYPVAHKATRLPMLCAGGIYGQNVQQRVREAQAAGHVVVGIDVATGVQLLGERAAARSGAAHVSSHEGKRFDVTLIKNLRENLDEMCLER